ncbi:MAG TPA: hypothetical protein VFK13_15805 [Gemmatimonadaceae bacterium]|nr:hypothetical protein [Gemmatimonadaceae bacterium]
MITIEPGISPWEAEGRRAASAVGTRAAVALLAHDPDAAALVALGIARVQARRRRVAIADLVGEIAPLMALTSEVTYGLNDMFVHGVSVGHVVQGVPGAPNLYVMPSGAGPVDHEAILHSARWGSLVQGFRDGDALLLVVVPPGAPGLEELLGVLDGVVLVGSVPEAVPARVLFTIPEPKSGQTAPWIPVETRRRDVAVGRWQRTRTRLRSLWQQRAARVAAIAAGVLVLAGGAALYAWRASRTDPSSTIARQPGAPAETVQRSAAAIAPETAPLPAAVNPTDSADAALFAVHVTSFNNPQGAGDRVVEARSARAPAVTYAPASYEGALWYDVVAGAYRDSAAAARLVREMRRLGTLRAGEGADIVRLPYALRVAEHVTVANAHDRAEELRARGWPAYALLQRDGSVTLYVGAFASPEQAARMRDDLGASDDSVAAIAYRTGRAF